jgi:uncharacterized membrane protein YhfC
MKKEDLIPKVENVAMVVSKEVINGEENYYVYLVNLRDDIMEGIIVTSTGYGENLQTGEKIKTSTLRHSLEVLLPNEAAKIEPIMEEVFGLTNEFLVSFWVEDKMYDKKFIFLADSIKDENMVDVPSMGRKGVVIQ